MTDASELQTRVDEMISNVERSYTEAVKTVDTLKDRINQLEQARLKEGSAEDPTLRRELDSAVDRLDAFVDSWILKSKDTWTKYRTLEKEFVMMKESHFDRFNALKDLCEQSEQLAKDLLCYSLGHLKRVGRL